jgi:hypothetical protein
VTNGRRISYQGAILKELLIRAQFLVRKSSARQRLECALAGKSVLGIAFALWRRRSQRCSRTPMLRGNVMVTESSRQGLIVSTSPRSTAPLDELIVCCGWPALLEVTPLRFRRELLLGVPTLSLFWMDNALHVGATVRLLAWLRAYQPAVRRVAVGYRLSPEVEVEVRSAGAHVYLPAADDFRSLLEGSIAPWVCGHERAATELSERPFARLSARASQGVPLPPAGPP